jgi:hypothetical protein
MEIGAFSLYQLLYEVFNGDQLRLLLLPRTASSGGRNGTVGFPEVLRRVASEPIIEPRGPSL